MTLPEDHQTVEVESFEDPNRSERRGRVFLRPVKDQKFPTSLLLEGNRSLVQDYPVGTRFKVQVSLMKRPGGEQYLFTSWQWDSQVLSQPDPGT
jgi:hypothetical protein